MNKKAIAILVILLVVLAGFLTWKSMQKARVAQQNSPNQQITQTQQQDQEKKQKFVVDVDPNVDHWQTKGENEAFTIKFPKEWYWLESAHDKNKGYSNIITNNPDFNINKYSDIGIFTEGNYLYYSDTEGGKPMPIQLNNTEVVITNKGSATSDAGTPQDKIDSIFKLAKQNNPSVDCRVTNNKTIPFTAYCKATYESELRQTYYIINDKISLAFTARTTKDTLVKKEILDQIAKSIILK